MINIKRVSQFLNFIIVLLIVIDMGGELGFRRLAFALLFISVLILIFCSKRKFFCISYLIPFVIFILYPTIHLYISFTKNFDIALSISQVSVFYFSFLYFILRVLNPEMDGMKNFNYAFIFMATFYLIMLLCFFINKGLYFSVTDYIHSKGAGFAGTRNDSSIQLANVYLKSSLFLIFTFCYYLKQSTFLAAYIFIGSFITTSKTLFIMQTALLAWNKKRNIYFLALVLVVFCLIMYFFYDSLLSYIDYILMTLMGKSETVSIRSQHFSDYFHLAGNDLYSLIFGFGPGSTFHSSVFGSNTSNIEIDHINIIRKFGILFFLLFTMLIAFIVLRLRKIKRYNVATGLLLSFVLAGTNPVLLSPVFFILLIECYMLVNIKSVRSNYIQKDNT